VNKFSIFMRSLFAYSVVGCALFISFFPCFIIACLPIRWRYDNPVYFLFINFFYRISIWSLFLPIIIEGKRFITSQPAIYVANHQSSLDIPLLGSLVNGHPHVWYFWVKFAKIPFFGFILRRMNIIVDPRGLRRLVRSIDKGLEIIKETKSNIMIFPEGGRFLDGKVHKFFHGFGILAQKTKRPVVPVVIYNVNKVYPPGAFLMEPHPIHMVIGKPFYIRPEETEADFVQRVHTWFVEKTAE
jgi:1-acyl-sn-glycerol-3-phosphate acyltransferase